MEGRGKREDNLGLGSRADQWPRCVGADLISQVKADADATELQGDGEALGGNARKTRGRKTRSRSLGAKEKATDRSLENSSGRGETENSSGRGASSDGRKREDSGPPRSTAAR